MKISTPILFLMLLAAFPHIVAAAEPEVIYWNSDAGKVLRATKGTGVEFFAEERHGRK